MSSDGRLRAVTAISSSIAAIAVLAAGLLGYFVAYPAVTTYFNDRFAAVDGKVAAMERQIAAVEKKASESSNDGIAQLAASLAKANAALARIKDKIDLPADTSAATASLTTLGASVDKVNASLLRVEQAVMTKLSALDGAATDRAVAKVGNSVDSLKVDLTADLKGLSDAVAGLRADQSRSLAALDSSMDAIKTGLDAPANAVKADLTTSMNAIKTNLDASMTAIKAGINDLSKADAPTASVPAADKSELVVISFAAPKSAPTPASAAVPRMSVHYDRIGGLNDDGQAAAIANKLKALIEGRDGCAIAVSGHADTLGSDTVNLDISRARAAKVAAALKTALAGQAVPITEVGWGERDLAEWTPNETGRKANRRVDIAVSCKS